jgi:hypothetical protein
VIAKFFFSQKGEIRQSEMKEVIETAIAQVDGAGI